MKGSHLLLQEASPLLEGWMWYERKDDTRRNGRRMLLPRADLLLTSTHSSFWPPKATWPQRHQTSSFIKGTLTRHRNQASVMAGMDVHPCSDKEPAEIQQRCSTWWWRLQLLGWLPGHPGGTPCPPALEKELLGVFNSSDLTQCHNIPVFQSGRGSDATPSTRPFLLAAQHPIQAQSGKALVLKFTEH